jgi:ABC-type ATPase with predicted acetyltransferase domain
MTNEQVKEILDRVLTWPLKRQEDAARVLREMEEQDASPYRLTIDQAEEVERRRTAFAEREKHYASDEEMAALWKKCGL